jgi:hypothetical protein
MYWQRPRFTPMTPQFRCSFPATARPGQPDCGPMCVTIGREAIRPLLAVWFACSEDRKGEHPRRHLKDFKGALQADAYSGSRKGCLY